MRYLVAMSIGRPAVIGVIFLSMAGFDLLYWRWADAKLRPLRHAAAWRTLLAGWMGWMVVYLLLAIFFPGLVRKSHNPVPTPLHAAVYLWHLLILPASMLVAGAVGLANFWARAVRPARPVIAPAQSEIKRDCPVFPSDLHSPTRRQLLTGAAITLPPILTMGAAGVSLAQLSSPVRIRRLELSLARLPLELDGMTIAHLTDMHIGKFTRPGILPGIVAQMNQLKADFVMVTGDIIDISLSDLPAGIDMLRAIDPRNGMFICEGNHDVMEDGEIFEQRMWASGLPFLADESRNVIFRDQRMQFLGVRWTKTDPLRSASVMRMKPALDPDAFPILLAHHPHAFDAASSIGIPLTLSGHTHGGQLMLTKNIGAGPALFKYWSGIYRKDENALLVANGVGAWFPLRVNAPAEIVHLTLRSAPVAKRGRTDYIGSSFTV